MLRFLWYMSSILLLIVGIVLIIKMWVVPAIFVISLGSIMWIAETIDENSGL